MGQKPLGRRLVQGRVGLVRLREPAQGEAGDRVQYAGQLQLGDEPVHPVGGLVGVFQKEHRAVQGAGSRRCPEDGRAVGEVAAQSKGPSPGPGRAPRRPAPWARAAGRREQPGHIIQAGHIQPGQLGDHRPVHRAQAMSCQGV